MLKSLLTKVHHVDEVDGFGQTALYYAARHQDKHHVTLLVTSGANPNHIDKHGQTSLFFAARYNNDKTVMDELVRLKTNPNIQDISKRCALDYAIRYNTFDVVVQLGRSGADLHLVGKHNFQALAIPDEKQRTWSAIKNGFRQIVFSTEVVEDLSQVVVQDTPAYDENALEQLLDVQRAFAAEHLLFHAGQHDGDDGVDYWYNRLQCGDLAVWIGSREVVVLRLLLPPHTIGYISFRVRSNLVNINHLVICWRNRHKGLGSQLLAAAQRYVSRLDGHDPEKCIYRLTCYANNPAFRFYWNHGFRLDGEVFDSCEDALKALSGRGDSVGTLTVIENASDFGSLKVPRHPEVESICQDAVVQCRYSV